MSERENRKEQQKVHMDFFDRAKAAKEHGFYLETIFLCYAAIEGRLEIMCGVLGCPCSKNAPDNVRTKINISQRIKCLRQTYKKNVMPSICEKDLETFKAIEKWIGKRNIYTHGLYKNAGEYAQRQKDAANFAEEGFEIASKLYTAAKRLRRLRKNGRLDGVTPICKNKKCDGNPDKDSQIQEEQK